MRIKWVGPDAEVPGMGVARRGEFYEVSDKMGTDFVSEGRAVEAKPPDRPESPFHRRTQGREVEEE